MDHSLQALIAAAEGIGLAEAARRGEMKNSGLSREEIDRRMEEALLVMRQSAEKGFDENLKSMSGMTGGQAAKLHAAVESGKTSGGHYLGRAAARALAIAECNAAMGKIVAAPTAGACGILPAALLTLQEEYDLSDEALVDGLLVAAAVGQVIAVRASISGAQGGCQAECGSAAAMAAAALTYLRGGSARQSADACAFALMNVMGLVCDPVGGLVEVPCVYRNASGVAGAFIAADLALAGIPCPLNPDEVIDAMKAVGEQLPPALRETGEGGCAGCPSACKRI
ncbi:MAG: L-serine ammonia-lyase, iron-sulfur-dependent, subunit alpha [Clostridiales bacterium]|nr:L-serine ammonia-lyase, iron-sulfur-dependent, subunit alpha [Clostridiales bacterium]